MIWIYKSISNKIDHYNFWNDRVIEMMMMMMILKEKQSLGLPIFNITAVRTSNNV